MIITLPKGSLVTVDGVALSEHNRSELTISHEPLKTDNRLANGSLRRYYVGTKRTFNVSWDALPALDTQTVDGKTGRNSLKTLYTDNLNTPITLVYKEVNTSNVQQDVTVTVFIEKYDESLQKRHDRQYWNVAMVFVEQ